MAEFTAPASIIIVGSGVFGLSTALSLSLRPAFSNTRITILDKSPFPSPDGASIDSSRIIRADYKDPLYSALAAEAQVFWRGHDSASSPFGGELGRSSHYHESGLVLVGDDPKGCDYIFKSMENAEKASGGKVRCLDCRDAIRKACKTNGVTGEWGYVSSASGWADAEEGMRFLRTKVEARHNIAFLTAEVEVLLYTEDRERVRGVQLKSGKMLEAELTILASGSWTPGLIDLEGRAVATGQVMAYVKLSEEQQERYESMPTILNLSSGLFVLPPHNCILKVARHAVGYINHVKKLDPHSGKSVEISVPKTSRSHPGLQIPLEGETDLRRGLGDMVPEIGSKPFLKTRMCWYTDTPTGDFIVTYHPTIKGLFLATGGSGHAYKFLPVLGEEVVDIVEGLEGARFKEVWRWREMVDGDVITNDGSRGGLVQVELDEALRGGGFVEERGSKDGDSIGITIVGKSSDEL